MASVMESDTLAANKYTKHSRTRKKKVLSGLKRLKDTPTRHQMDMKLLQTLPTRCPAKVVSESVIVISIVLPLRLQPSKAYSVWSSPAMRDGCTKLAMEILNILNQSFSITQTSG